MNNLYYPSIGSASDGPQRADPARGAQVVEHLVGRRPRLRQFGGVDTPHGGEVRASGRVVQAAVSEELVGLLAVFAADLILALSGDGAVAGKSVSRKAQCQSQIDIGDDGARSRTVLFGAARGEDDGVLGAGERAVSTMSSSGTPVMRSTGSGQ